MRFSPIEDATGGFYSLSALDYADPRLLHGASDILPGSRALMEEEHG